MIDIVIVVFVPLTCVGFLWWAWEKAQTPGVWRNAMIYLGWIKDE